MSKKFRVLLGRPVGLSFESTDVGTFMAQFALFCKDHPLIEQVDWMEQRSSRIGMNRNILMREALRLKADFLLMIDPDMAPDMYVGNPKYPKALSFLESSFRHMLQTPFGVIAAPATGDPPDRKINVFITDQKTGKGRRITHREANERHNDPFIEQVHGIGTGLILIHVPSVVSMLEEPYFDDVYVDKAKTDLSLSQDIYFTQNCTVAGVDVWCNWYSYCGHNKTDTLGIPEITDEPNNPPDEPGKFPLPVTLDPGNGRTGQPDSVLAHAPLSA